jgi:zinc protease
VSRSAPRSWAALCLLFSAFVPSLVSAQDVSIPHEIFRLDNGLTFLVNQDPSIPVVAVDVWYHVGSGYEDVGRTGFAHLFEHVMFEGSANVPEGDFDNLLEAAGAVNNGSTNTDRTNYYEILPSNALELALWLEADRMGGLLETMNEGKLDIQRDVVKNERRQSYENRPYGMLFPTAVEALYPEGHPYSWPTIGSMEDLSAASLQDVEAFFRRFYAPNNAVVAVSGDVRTGEVRALAERYFGWIPRGDAIDRPNRPTPRLETTRYITLEDRVTLPRVTLIWRTPEAFAEEEAALEAIAEILTSGKNSRLYRRLVYEEQVAQDVSAFNWTKLLSSDFFVTVTGRQGVDLTALELAIREEIARLAAEGPTEAELERVVNGIETDFISGLETAIGRAEQMNHYYYYTGDPDYAGEDLGAYRALTPEAVRRVAAAYLDGANRVVISIVPEDATELAAREVLP